MWDWLKSIWNCGKRVVARANNYIQNIQKTWRKILNTIKFFTTTIGMIVGWLIIIVFIVILFRVIADVCGEVIANWLGYTNYPVEDADVDIIKQLYNSGYESTIDAENFQTFRSFEYAVLMDTAEYIRTMKQEKYDIHNNQGEYAFEKSLVEERLKEEVAALRAQWAKEYNMERRCGNSAYGCRICYRSKQNK